jgi:hypothetical protein
MEPDDSLPCSQQPATGYPEPDESSPHFSSYFFRIHFNIIYFYTQVSQTVFPFKFSDLLSLSYSCHKGSNSHMVHGATLLEREEEGGKLYWCQATRDQSMHFTRETHSLTHSLTLRWLPCLAPCVAQTKLYGCSLCWQSKLL